MKTGEGVVKAGHVALLAGATHAQALDPRNPVFAGALARSLAAIRAAARVMAQA